MTRALIIGGGVAGPVTAMALQRAGIDAAVYEAHTPTTEEVGSYLTVATNGIDALRAIGADQPVLDAGFPTPTNLLWSSSGRRLGAVANGGMLPDGTTAHTIKRARLYRTLHQQVAGRGIQVEFGKRLRDVAPTPTAACLPASRTAPPRPVTCWWAPTGSTRPPATSSTPPRAGSATTPCLGHSTRPTDRSTGGAP